MFTPNPILSADFYKLGHVFQYPFGTTEVYSNLTPRSDKLAPMVAGKRINKVVNFGVQGFVLEWLLNLFSKNFFALPKEEVLKSYKELCDNALGKDSVSTDHIAALHDLGYLPIEIKALPEGAVVGMKVPLLTVRNTHPNFYWVTNYIETMLSAELWQKVTSATIAFEYRKLLEKYAKLTGSPKDFVMWQGHDFSLRGMPGISAGAASGAGHMCSFFGTDTIPAIKYHQDYYGAGAFVGGSVPATEHSVMSAGGSETETETYKRLITEVYPGGIVSIVSDTWDFWNVVTNIASELKTEILNRKPNELGLAKVVFRPDSGDPVKIVCGDPDASEGTPERKGAIECLWEIFGGTTTETGHRMLNPRVGLIYGDSITLNRAEKILEGLRQKGFASGNVVFGVGSFTYQYVTRDTFGMAMKATSAVIDGKRVELFKNPKTDNGVKKSARGLLRVDLVDGEYVMSDQQTEEQADGGELKVVFRDGTIETVTTTDEIRKRIDAEIQKYLATI